MKAVLKLFGFGLATVLAAYAGDSPLADIRLELEQTRGEALQHEETRGASPRLTIVKHKLRDWVEAKLDGLPSDDNGDGEAVLALAAQLNEELKRERLFRSGGYGDDDDGRDFGGFLGPVVLEYRGREGYLVLQTAIEVTCGFDESAYLYRRQDGQWKRIWETEQNTYTKDRYKVQRIRAVLLSPPFNAPSPYVLTLGTEPWCSSNWHDLYVRLWKLGSSDEDSRLLLDESEWAFLGEHDIPVQGSIGREDALIEYTIGSIDGGVFSRESVLHYSLAPDAVKRIDPIALSPRDFVEEWLSEPWEQSRRWSQPSAHVVLRKVHHDTGPNEFIDPTRHCRTPDLWQVGLGSSDGEKPPVYYLIRWRPPYHFTMVGASPHSYPGCVEKDPGADEYRTLFPVQDWRE
jgi:hypothetical protein